jgi:hypothetical protein
VSRRVLTAAIVIAIVGVLVYAARTLDLVALFRSLHGG